MTDRQTDRQTDGCTGKTNMSPDPEGGGDIILKEASWGTFMQSYMKFEPVVQMSFEEKLYGRRTDGRMHDGQRPFTIAHLKPLAQVR